MTPTDKQKLDEAIAWATDQVEKMKASFQILLIEPRTHIETLITAVEKLKDENETLLTQLNYRKDVDAKEWGDVPAEGGS